MNSKEDIVKNLNSISERIKNACLKSNRNPNEVKLLLATKTVTAENIRIALNEGHRLIGENKVQELKEKYDFLINTPHENHFIGHLQSNKIKDIIKYNVTCIHSIDNIELATKLNTQLALSNKKIDILIQVNTSNEESKFGLKPEQTILFVKSISTLKNIHIKGLMTIGLFSADIPKVRICFKTLKAIQNCIIAENIPNVDMSELSMGMSHDLETAIEEGATIVRVGTAIFGQRKYPDAYYWNEKKVI